MGMLTINYFGVPFFTCVCELSNSWFMLTACDSVWSAVDTDFWMFFYFHYILGPKYMPGFIHMVF
jgi:hypothetical protein